MYRRHLTDGQARRQESAIENMKEAVTRGNPKMRHEDVDTYTKRIRKAFSSAIGTMMHRQGKLYSANRVPHQGAQECARRRLQSERGQIFNYDRATHYEPRGKAKCR